MKYLLRWWSMMTPFIPFLIVTSLYEVFVEGMEFDDIFYTSAHCDLTVWSIYWRDGVWWHLSYFCSLWTHCMKYLLRWWSMITPFISLLIVTSLYEVIVEGMEDDDTFHNFSHCDLNVWSIYQNSLHSPPLSTESPLFSNDIREHFIYWSLKLSITKHRLL